MRYFKIGILACLTAYCQPVNCQSTSGKVFEKFSVPGKCGMCKSTIENAALKGGVDSANWSKKAWILTVYFDSSKTSLDRIQKSIAMAGYDTPLFKAPKESYNALPGCCLYRRELEE